MLLASLLALAVAPTSTVPAPEYSLRFGLSEVQWRVLDSNTLGHVSRGYVMTQMLHTASGDSLVRWSSTPDLDPRGPNALGLQMYGPDGTFRRWLPDTAGIDRDFVVCGRFLVGGDNTLRVWDTEQNYVVVLRRALPDSFPLARLRCIDQTLVLEDSASKAVQKLPLLRLFLPRPQPLPTGDVPLLPLFPGRQP